MIKILFNLKLLLKKCLNLLVVRFKIFENYTILN
jgi:hypothetical protein